MALPVQVGLPRPVQRGREAQRDEDRERVFEPVEVLYEEHTRRGTSDEREADEGQEPPGGPDEAAGSDDEQREVGRDRRLAIHRQVDEAVDQ